MELRIVVFLGFVAFGTLLNTILIFGAYIAFASLTSKVTTTVTEFQKNNEVRQFIDSMQTVGKQAVTITENTKQRIAEFEPVIAKAQDSFGRTLGVVDSKLEETAKQMDTSARKIRDAVAKPAVSTMAFVAGLMRVFESIRDE
jgi:biopolymer transport protein ExbB/TolQ